MAGRSLLPLLHPASPAFKLFSGLLLWSISSLNEKILLGALHSSSEDKVSRPEIGSLGCKWRSLCVARWFITVWLRSRFRKSSHTQSGSQISLTQSRGLRGEIQSVFCLSFFAIYEYRNGSPGDMHRKAFWYLFQVIVSADTVKTPSFRLRLSCVEGKLGAQFIQICLLLCTAAQTPEFTNVCSFYGNAFKWCLLQGCATSHGL